MREGSHSKKWHDSASIRPCLSQRRVNHGLDTLHLLLALIELLHAVSQRLSRLLPRCLARHLRLDVAAAALASDRKVLLSVQLLKVADRHTATQTDRHTDTQRGRQTERQTEERTHVNVCGAP